MSTFTAVPLVPHHNDEADWRDMPDRLRDQIGLPPVAGTWYTYIMTGDTLHVRLAIYANPRLAEYTYKITDHKTYTIDALIKAADDMHAAGSTSYDEWYDEDRNLKDFGAQALIEWLLGGDK